MVAQRNVLVPGRHDREARGAAPDRDLAVPLIQKALDEGETLPAAGIAKAADTLDQRCFEGRAIAPAVAKPLGVGALERTAKADPRVAHRDHHHPPAQAAAEGIRL